MPRELGFTHTCLILNRYASDGELVPFGASIECRGAVEDWLGRLMRHCAASLRDQLGDSVNAYLEMPRDKWSGDAARRARKTRYFDELTQRVRLTLEGAPAGTSSTT